MDKRIDQPLVSVLMTAYNREKYIAEAIESVLASTYSHFELIIVDDQSKDRTVEIAKSYEAHDERIKVYINEVNLGDYPNRNKAASYAKGKYLKYVDSDDMIYPESLSVMVEAMEIHPEAAIGLGSREQNSEIRQLTSREAYYNHFNVNGCFHIGPLGAIIKRSDFETVGGFLELRNVGDFDFWLKISARYPVVMLPKGLVFWRQHSGQEINLAPEFYTKHNLNIERNHLKSKYCPLAAKESQLILEKHERQLKINLIKGLLKSFDFRKFYSLWKENELSLFK